MKYQDGFCCLRAKSPNFGEPVHPGDEKLYNLLTKKSENAVSPIQRIAETVKNSKEVEKVLAILVDIRYAKGVIFYT